MKNHIKEVVKKLFLVIFVLIFYTPQAQSVYVYDCYGKRIFLQKTNKMVVNIIDTSNGVYVQYLQAQMSHYLDYIPLATDMYFVDTSASDILKNENVSKSNLYLLDNDYYWASNVLYVKPNRVGIINEIENGYVLGYNLLTERVWQDNDVFAIHTSFNNDDIIDFANMLYESKEFDFVQLDWWCFDNNNDMLDSLNLNIGSTPSSYNNLHIQEAWNMSTGTGVNVAVIDEGVDINHVDLASNMLPGYDATDKDNAGGSQSKDCHGTACAGIISALNNNIGITGIAYNARIIPVRITYNTYFFGNRTGRKSNVKWTADGIRTSWETYQADILSCSWTTSNLNPLVREAIKDALKNGRDGKGCVVVVASGNDDLNELDPECKISNVIAVGAVSPCDERKSVCCSCDNDDTWGSNYGDSMSVVAPGVNVSTLRNNNRYTNISGTSAACPFVSGVAALMLSSNPILTSRQVKAIMEINATLIRTDLYYYGYYPEYLSSLWNEEVGYGLINARDAVYDAINISNVLDLYIKDATDDRGYEPYSGNLPINQSPDIWVSDINGDPVEQIESGHDYTINVKVRNDCNVPSSGHEILHIECYWAQPTRIMNYPIQNYFDPCHVSTYRQFTVEMTQVINQIDSVVYSTPFKAPNLIGEGCLSANIQTVPVSILAWVENEELVTGTQNRNVAMEAFAKDNNNAAMRDYTLTSAQYNTLPLVVDNVRDFPSYNRIGFRAFRNGSNHRIGQYATVYLKMSKNMYTNWLLKGGQGQGFVMVDTAKFRITDTSAYFDSIFFDAGEYETLTVEVDESSTIDPLERFEFDISQRCLACESYEMPEGRITIAYQSRVVPIKARAHSSQTIVVGDEVTLTADDADEAVRYRWLDQSGLQLAVSQTINVSPSVTQRYILEVMALSDSAKAYDTVTITVVRGHIETISPNPTSGDVQVVSRIAADVTAAQLTVSNSNGLVVRTVPVSTANRTVLNLQGLPSGLYYVQLGTSNEVFDVKTLIVR